MRKAKTTIMVVIFYSMLLAPIVISAGMITFKWYHGYYPVPYIVKLVYYSFKYHSSWRVEQIVDPHFKINNSKYEVEYKFKNMLNMPYYIFVKFNPKSDTLPSDFQYTGKLKISVEKDNKVQFSHIINGVSKEDQGALNGTGSTDGYYVAILPFPLKNSTYTNAKLKIAVIDTDSKFAMYCSDVQISILPEIDLDSGISDYKLER